MMTASYGVPVNTAAKILGVRWERITRLIARGKINTTDVPGFKYPRVDVEDCRKAIAEEDNLRSNLNGGS